ncbi:MAG: hypothetical protein ACHQ9S_18970 [Candidatus Binatia bacterium]
MMRRHVYSKRPEWSTPLVEVQWDKSALMIEARDGTLDIKAIVSMYSQAIQEITDAIIAGKRNAKKQVRDGGAATAGTPAPNKDHAG